jgi:hypothetical protein
LPSADRIEVVDEVTVRLHLDRPVAWGLIGNALLSSSSIVHAREILKHATADDPYGLKWLETKTVESWAFVIDTWQKGSMMSLVPNPHALQPSTLERIILQVVPDASTRRIILERGDVDFAVQLATKDIPDLRQVCGVKVTSYPSARGWWLGMTWNKAPFNDRHFRRAMAWAMPYDKLLQVATHGLAERSRRCVPNNISGYGGDYWPYETGILGVAMPLFWFGLILVYVFYYTLGIAPAPTGRLDMLVAPPPHVTGLYVVDSLLSADLEALWSSLSHLVLPVMTLTFIVAASIARMTYTSMRRVLSAPYILIGHAYGFAPHRLIYKYALKNALMPVITFVGLQVAFLIGGVVLVLLVYLCVNLLADVLYGLVNPQVRAGMA